MNGELQASKRKIEVGNVPVLLLVGGLGTRLRSVLPDSPKPLAPIGPSSFLRLLVEQLSSQGIRRLILCTGHRAAQIEQEFADGRQLGVAIEYSKESQPLGTGGAVKLAEHLLADCAEFVVMNGDSFLELNLGKLLDFHLRHGGAISIAVRRVPDAARYGTVQVDRENRVTGFMEKSGARSPGLINGGVYVFSHKVVPQIPDGPASLEKDIFPNVLEQGVYAMEQHGMFIDIGTPEDYARAQALYESLRAAANTKSAKDDEPAAKRAADSPKMLNWDSSYPKPSIDVHKEGKPNA